VTPERFQLPPGLATEEYFDMLQTKLEREEKEDDGPGCEGGQIGGGAGPRSEDSADQCGGTQQSVDRSQGQGGSSHDGKRRPWEDGLPSDVHDHGADGSDDGAGPGAAGKDRAEAATSPGYDHGDLDVLIEYTSKQIEEWQGSHGKGSVPGSLVREARQILHPTVDPVARLESLLRHSMDATYGYGLFTYRRPSRRQPPGGAIQPVHRKPVPKLLVIADTSRSMGERDLSLVLGVVERVIRKLPDSRGVEVWAGDTAVAAVSKVFRPEQVQLAGGGGTDMSALIMQAIEKPKPPDVILVCTDGEEERGTGALFAARL